MDNAAVQFCPLLQKFMSRPQSRSERSLNSKLERSLATYAIAAGAAGMGLLALAPSAAAEVVYTPAHVRIGTDGLQTYSLDVNHDGVPDFYFLHTHATNNIGLYVNGVGSGEAGVQVGKEFPSQANARKAGGAIGPEKHFTSYAAGQFAEMARKHINSSNVAYYFGSWVNVKGRYLGLRFNIGGETHYGWARFNLHFDNGLAMHATLTGYAYETKADKAIVAGDEGAGALACLALGRAGNKQPVAAGR